MVTQILKGSHPLTYLSPLHGSVIKKSQTSLKRSRTLDVHEYQLIPDAMEGSVGQKAAVTAPTALEPASPYTHSLPSAQVT